MKQFLCFLLLMTLMGCTKEKQTTIEPQSTIEHIVMFWANDSTPMDILDSIKVNSAKLDTIPGVIDITMGEALQSERAIVDASFTLGFIFSFPDKPTMDAYIVHPGHKEFVEKWIKPNLKKLVMYDIKR